MEIELKPWQTPNFVVPIVPTVPAQRQDGFNPNVNSNAISLENVPVEILSEMCDKFRSEIFKKAKKKDPNNE